MNRTVFFETVKELVAERVKAEFSCPAETELIQLKKANCSDTTALRVKLDDGSGISPSFRLLPLYDTYLNGKSVNDIVNDIIGMLHKKVEIAIPDFDDAESIKQKLFCKVINRDINEEYLRDAVYMKMLDLAVVCYILVDYNGKSQSSMLLTKELADMYGFEPEDTVKFALENTRTLFPEKYLPLETIAANIFNPMNTAGCANQVCYDMPMVLTNASGMNGFTSIFYNGLLKEISGGHNFIILPSSIHEAILFADNGCYTHNEFLEMVKEVNSTEVDAQDFLCDNVYYYDAATDMFSTMEAYEKKKACE